MSTIEDNTEGPPPFVESEVVYRWTPDGADHERDDSLADEYVVARPEWARGTICVFLRYENDLPNAWSDDGEEDVIAHLLGRLIAAEPGPDSDIRRRLALADAQIAQLTVALAERNAEIGKIRTDHSNLVDKVVHYRNLSITLGAKPEQMCTRYDHDLAAKGDADNTMAEYIAGYPEIWEEANGFEAERDQLRTRNESLTAALGRALDALKESRSALDPLRALPAVESDDPHTMIARSVCPMPGCILAAEVRDARAAHDKATLAIAAVESILKGEADAE